MQPAVEIIGLSKKYDSFCLKEVTLTIPNGSITGLIGQNGAGKSTLIKCILDLVWRDAGRVLLPCVNRPEVETNIRSFVGYIPETLTFYEWMTVWRLIKFVSAYYPAWDHDYSQSLLARYELDPTKKVKHLSKGMQAKLALLLALSHKPPVLILDEPTLGLDPIMKYNFLQELLHLVTSGTTKAVLISSHILGEVEQVADRVAILRAGTLAVSTDTASFLAGWTKITYYPKPGHEHLLPVGGPAHQLGDGRRMLIVKGDWLDAVEQLKRQGAQEIQVTKPDMHEIFVQVA